jgi:hypothetical protein
VAFTASSEDFKEVLHTATTAVEAALRVGHRRASMIARAQVGYVLIEMLEFDEARRHLDALIADARALGARRFEGQGLATLAELLLAEGNRPAARDLLLRALILSREIGFAFAAAYIFGGLSRAAADDAERRRYLAEGEESLSAGALSFNFFYFYRSAIEASLDGGDFDAVDRYADAFDRSGQSEPLPWARFFARRGRALAEHGRGRRDGALHGELLRLRDEAAGIHASFALRRIEAALADFAASAKPLSA